MFVTRTIRMAHIPPAFCPLAVAVQYACSTVTLNVDRETYAQATGSVWPIRLSVGLPAGADGGHGAVVGRGGGATTVGRGVGVSAGGSDVANKGATSEIVVRSG